MDCDRPLEDIYGETMEIVKVSFCMSSAGLSLIHGRVSSPRSARMEMVLGLFTTRTPRLKESNLFQRRKMLQKLFVFDRL